MPPDPVPPVPLERLLEHRPWVKSLARALVRDPWDADDLEQDIWLASMETPPEREGAVRRWFRVVARHAAGKSRRGDVRRLAREEVAARPEAEKSTAEVVAEAEALRRVVVAVMDLEEPYRATVLLRWFEDLPPAAIADRQGVPVETVRTRLRRAVERLRERLDEENRGDRKAWVLALLPLTRPLTRIGGPAGTAVTGGAAGTGTAAVVGGLLMAKKIVAVAAAALLLLGTAGWWVMRPTASPSPGLPDGPKAVATAPGPGAAAVPAETKAPGAAPAPAGARLALRVVDAAGRPVAGARATVEASAPKDESNPWRQRLRVPSPGTQPGVSATTGTDGAAALEGLAPGASRLRVTSSGFAVHQEDLRVTLPGEEMARTVVLLPAWTLEGTVFGAEGTPLPGAEVLSEECAARTDSAGKYRLEGLPPGSHGISVRAGGAMYRNLALVSVPGPRRVDLRLEGGAVLEGRVLDDATGAPVPGARVFLLATLASGYPRMVSFTREVTSGPDGTYRMDGVPPANADMLEVRAEGYLLFSGWNVAVFPPHYRFARGDRLRVDVRLRRGVALRGRITGPDGIPVAGASVEVLRGRASSETDAPTGGTTGADGTYAIRSVPGVALIRVRSRGLLQPGLPEDLWDAVRTGNIPDACRVTVAPEGETVRDVTLEREKATPPGTAVIAGTVRREDGAPLDAAWVVAYSPGGTEHLAPVLGDGGFRFEGLPSGKHGLEARTEGLPAVSATVEGLAEGEVRTGVVLVLPPGRDLEGRVVDTGGDPVPGAVVKAGPFADRGEDRPVSAATDADGRFAVRGLPPGDAFVEVSAPGFLATSRKVEAGETSLLLTLEKSLSISGTVADEERGRPVAGILVWVNRTVFVSGTHRIREATTDDAGRFRIDGLEPVEYDICTGRIGDTGPTGEYSPSKTERVKAGTADLRIVLHPGLAIAGRVEDGEGRPAGGGTVDVNGPEGGPPVWQRAAIARDGTFRIPGLPPGSYVLQANPGGGLAPVRLPGVAAGRTDLVLRSGAALTIQGRLLLEDGTPLPVGNGGFELRWKNPDGTSASTGIGVWKMDGSFETPPLDPERVYDIVFWGRPGFLGGAARNVPPGTRDLVITMEKGGVIEGRVVDEGDRPLPGIWVGASGPSLMSTRPEPGGSGWATTDASGTFRIAGLAAVPYSVHAGGSNSDFLPASVKERVVPGSAEVRLQLRRGSFLSGKVVDATGKPLREGRVSTTNWGADCTIGEGGTFTLRGIPPGECTLFLQLGNRTLELGKVTAPAENLVLTAPGE